MKKTAIFLSLGAICVVVGFVVYLLRTDVKMVFPKTPHGNLIQDPVVVTTGTVQFVQWTIPKVCLSNSFEVQDVGYGSDPSLFWGGNTGASCEQVGDGYQCQAEVLPEMKTRPGQWNIQVSSSQCIDGDYFVSKVVQN